jgi:hypothetical protein
MKNLSSRCSSNHNAPFARHSCSSRSQKAFGSNVEERRSVFVVASFLQRFAMRLALKLTASWGGGGRKSLLKILVAPWFRLSLKILGFVILYTPLNAL